MISALDTLQFWISLILVLFFCAVWLKHFKQGWVLPAIATMVTVTVWYLVDVLYNNYEDYLNINKDAVDAAWWEVWLFIVAFGLMVAPVSRALNRKHLHRSSQFIEVLLQKSFKHPAFQDQIDRLALGLGIVWAIIMVVALLRVEGDFLGLVAPYLGQRVDPWSRERLGSGFDSLLSLCGYLQVFCASASGALFFLSERPKTRVLTGVLACLSIPFFIFHPRRNVILMTVLPSILSFVFLRCRGPLWVKPLFLLPFLLAIHLWLGFVIENRATTSIAAAFAEKMAKKDQENFEVVVEEEEQISKHKGLNMFEELTWINYLLESKILNLNWGLRYVAELSNPIPRALWPGKPTIGLDYAIARGFGVETGDISQGGVAATVSTGMIGEGVTCFGGLVGPIISAFLMALWAALLTRLDLSGRDPGNLFLYLLGCILTFNLGRDINLMNIYPLLFGMIILKLIKGKKQEPTEETQARAYHMQETRKTTRDPSRKQTINIGEDRS